MEQKLRKLVVHGPKDSGKSSWLNILTGVIPMERIATITEERQFSAFMITEDTELTSLYIYYFSTEIDFSSEKYSGSTGHRNSWYQ